MTLKNSIIVDNNICKKKFLREQFGILLPKKYHPTWLDLYQSDQIPHLHGDKIWNASRLLMDYLTQNPLEENQRILDVGCGQGVTSIFCTKHFNASVISNDADPAVFPYIDFLSALNECKTEYLACKFEEIEEELLSTIDILIGSDICFWDELEETVYELIQKAINNGVKKIIIADPNRPPFIAMAERCVDDFFGEIIPWKTSIGGKVSGSILIIENA